MFAESKTPSMYIKDQQLSIDVEAWLLSNKATVIPRGKSTAKEGYKNTINPYGMVISEEESRKRIEKTNSQVREKKEKAERYAKVSDTLFNDLINKVYDNARYGDIIAISKLCGINDSTIPNARKKGFMTKRTYELLKPVVDNYTFKKKEIKRPRLKPRNKKLYEKGYKLPPTRQVFVKLARMDAERNGKSTFMAPCINHGMTEFVVVSGGSRCVICRKIMTKKHNDKKNLLKKSNV